MVHVAISQKYKNQWRKVHYVTVKTNSKGQIDSHFTKNTRESYENDSEWLNLIDLRGGKGESREELNSSTGSRNLDLLES